MNVRHILPNGEMVSHEEMEFRLVEAYDKKGLLPHETYPKQLSQAYRLLNAERGYRMKRSPMHPRARKVRI